MNATDLLKVANNVMYIIRHSLKKGVIRLQCPQAEQSRSATLCPKHFAGRRDESG